MQRLVPAVPVDHCGRRFRRRGRRRRRRSTDAFCIVASGNPRNCKGLTDFVRLAWPRIRRRVPHAELVVVGGVGRGLPPRTVPGVTCRRGVEDMSPLYREAALVINPVVAGTGAEDQDASKRCVIYGRLSRGRPASTGWIRGSPRDVSSPETGTSSPNVVVDALTNRARRADSPPTIARSSPIWCRPKRPTRRWMRAYRTFLRAAWRARRRRLRVASGGRPAMPAVAHAD